MDLSTLHYITLHYINAKYQNSKDFIFSKADEFLRYSAKLAQPGQGMSFPSSGSRPGLHRARIVTLFSIDSSFLAIKRVLVRAT
jgi:hypothetical protein